MRITAFLLLCFAPPLVLAADLSPYSGPCEATLSAEAKFVEEGFSTVREKWRTKVRLAFDAKKLSNPQRASAESAFASLVAKMSDDFGKILTLPGMFRSMSLMPVLPLEACKDPKKFRTLGEQALSSYEKTLDKLVPMIDVVSDAARSE